MTLAWLKVTLAAVGASDSVHLERDGVTVESFRMTSAESVIVDEGLLPNRAYSYRAFLVKAGGVPIATPTVGVTTMDTTSHEFTWEIEYLGDGNSSLLRDVAIINDTLVYAVGEMYLRDSTGDFEIKAHNAACWDGRSWQLMRIPFIGPCSAVDYPPLTTVFALSDNEIYVSNGGSIVRFDGSHAQMDCGMNALLTGAINRLWGTSGNDVYAVGNNGAIVRHTNGTSWQKLESGTTLDVHDIWGGRNPRTGEMEILAVASHLGVTFDRAILRINGTDVSHLSSEPIIWPLESVWFSPGRRYYVAGSGIYQKTSLSDASWRRDSSATLGFYSYAIRGTDINDVIAVGGYGEVVHFNGMSWRSYRATTGLSDGNYLSVAIKGNLAVAVGWQYPRGVVAIGRR